MLWKTRRRKIDLKNKGCIVGILNITPDSFSDGGHFINNEAAVNHALEMLKNGAEIIDVGGESTRPGALKITEDEELARVIPVIKAIREVSDCLISIDTSKSVVALKAIQSGADIVNDVTGLLGDENMPKICAQEGVGVIVMHMQGSPKEMQNNPVYNDVLSELQEYFKDRYNNLISIGINPQCICFDPGIGFGKTAQHNLQILKNLSQLNLHNRPLMLGVSRKSIIGTVLNLPKSLERDPGTIALTSMGRMAGVMLHRVHDVKHNHQAMRMVEAVLDPK